MKKSTSFVVSLFALLLATAVWHMRDTPSAASPAEAKADESPIPTESKKFILEKQNGSLLQSIASTTNSPAVDLSKNFYKKSQTATDLRIFVESVKINPQEGGAIYAFDALQQCKILRSQLPSAKIERIRNSIQNQLEPLSERRLAAIDWLNKRCIGFTESELSVAEQNFLLSWGVEKDPLFNLRHRIIKRDRSESPEALLGEILKTQDPLLLAAVPTLSAFENTPTSKGGAVSYLDGEKFGGLDFEGYVSAWNWAICAVAETCGIQNEQLQLSCALSGECADSTPDHIRYVLGSEERFGRVAAVSNRLQQVIRDRNVQALLPKKKG